jgi:RNA polymerase sigma-70 factor (ECF subfamily)
MSPQEPTLVKLLQEGNQAAFTQLYHQYHKPLYTYARRTLKAGSLAEEAVQDIFLQIWQQRGRLDASQCFRGYLFTIARNYLLKRLIRASRESALRQEIMHAALASYNATEADLIAAEYEQIAREAIARLPPQRQQVFTLCRLEGLSYEEAAHSLGIGRGTVSDHMVKANRSIREYLLLRTGVSMAALLALYCG